MNATNAVTQERRHPLENRVPPPLVVVLIGVAMAVIAWSTPAVEIGRNVRFATGGIAIALGALVVVQGARTFWRNKTTINPVDLENASALVTSGVFRYSRNPMYVGFTAALVGWAVCLAAPWALVGPVGFVLFTTRFQIIPEERVMRSKFGQAYEDYRAQVRRWL
jgi:protein-S-isoprenylcysteine O-methyltransferase Ste14